MGLHLVSGCSAINPAAVKAEMGSGITRRIDRPPPEVFEASVLAVQKIRADSSYWNQLEIVEKDPAKGTVVAEQRLDSAVLPGVGTKDAIGIFVAEASTGDSDVTVVVLGSDQMPGSAGTKMASLNTGEGVVFPAIEASLSSIPEQPRAVPSPPLAGSTSESPVRAGGSTGGVGRVATPAVPTVAASSPPPVPGMVASAAAGGETVLDRVYGVLRDSGSWRPLVREVTENGEEEIRVGRWAIITTASGRVRLKIKDGAPAADAAKLALVLTGAGFAVDVEGSGSSSR